MDMGGIWDNWSEDESRLFESAMGEIGGDLAETIKGDEWVSFLYHEAMWDFEIDAHYRSGAYDAFVEYMQVNYGIEWDEIYDWEAYREAYDAA